MSNLTRYFIFAEGDLHESELIVVEDKSGEWVKFDDIKELLNSSHNKQSTPCKNVPYCCSVQRNSGCYGVPNCHE